MANEYSSSDTDSSFSLDELSEGENSDMVDSGTARQPLGSAPYLFEPIKRRNRIETEIQTAEPQAPAPAADSAIERLHNIEW